MTTETVEQPAQTKTEEVLEVQEETKPQTPKEAVAASQGNDSATDSDAEDSVPELEEAGPLAQQAQRQMAQDEPQKKPDSVLSKKAESTKIETIVAKAGVKSANDNAPEQDSTDSKVPNSSVTPKSVPKAPVASKKRPDSSDVENSAKKKQKRSDTTSESESSDSEADQAGQQKNVRMKTSASTPTDASGGGSSKKDSSSEDKTCMTNRLRQLEKENEELRREVGILRARSSRQQEEIDVRRKEKICKTLMYRLKDFHVYCNMVEKIQEDKVEFLHENERLCFDNLFRKSSCPTPKASLQGLFERHNSDGHTSQITKSKVYRIRRLYMKNKDVFDYYSIPRGNSQDVHKLLKKTLSCISYMEIYVTLPVYVCS